MVRKISAAPFAAAARCCGAQPHCCIQGETQNCPSLTLCPCCVRRASSHPSWCIGRNNLEPDDPKPCACTLTQHIPLLPAVPCRLLEKVFGVSAAGCCSQLPAESRLQTDIIPRASCVAFMLWQGDTTKISCLEITPDGKIFVSNGIWRSSSHASYFRGICVKDGSKSVD